MPDGFRRAFRWTESGGLQDLGTLPGGAFSRGLAINDRGQVTGSASTADGFDHAVLWTP
jgi:probable HAF family extracellular repeat protein